MSLKQLLITDVREVGVDVPTLSMYTPRVEVVEVLDSDGNPFPGFSTEIGTVTIDPDSATVSVMGSQTFTAVVTGGTATDFTYKWTVRSGNALLDSADNEESATYIFTGAGTTQIQCTVSDATAENSPQSNLSFVIVS